MIGRALDVVLTPPVEVVANRCLRARHGTDEAASCRACLDTCPSQALVLDPLEVRSEACNGCDRCVAACPVGALQPNATRRRELLAALSRPRRGATVTFACRVASAPGDAISVNCVATLDPWSVVVSLLVGAARAELCHGECAECPDGRGAVESCERIAGAANRVGGALALGACEVRAAPFVDDHGVAGRDPRIARRVSRRGLLRGWLRSGTDTAARVVAEHPADDDVADIRVRDLAATLLASRRLPSTSIDGVGLGARPRVADACTRCGACVAACPTGALKRGEPDLTNPSPNLMLYAARCTGCGVCADACPEHVVSVDPVLDLAECAPRPIQLIEELAVRCVHCGGAALAPFLPVCPECYRDKRGVAPSTGC